MSINRVEISGNLTRDPELRANASGTSVLKLGVAVNERRRNSQTGEWEDVPNYFNCAIFGNRAESLAPHLAKGTKVAIAGRLRWSQWEKDGQKRSDVSIIVDEIEFMSARSQGNQAPASGSGHAYQQPQPQRQYAQPQRQEEAYYDVDIPF